MSIELGILVGVVALVINAAAFVAGRHIAAKSDGAREARADAKIEAVERRVEDHTKELRTVWGRIDELRMGARDLEKDLKQIQSTLTEVRGDVKRLLEQRGCES